MGYTDFFNNTFLFKNLTKIPEDKIFEENVQVEKFHRGELIYSANKNVEKLCFVFSGECVVRSPFEDTPINSLKKYDSFGILSVLSENADFPTNVFATRDTTIYFIDREFLYSLLATYPEIQKALLKFLVKKIAFLNNKLLAFSRNTVEKRLASYLLLISEERSEFTLNLKHTAEAINAGRASLYRALTTLEEKRLIAKKAKTIIINDRKGLERI